MIEKTRKPEPKVRSITEIAEAAVSYFNAISGSLVKRGNIGYIDGKRWNAGAKDGFISFYDNRTVAVSGSIENAGFEEKDRICAVLRPVVHYYRDMTGRMVNGAPNDGEAFAREIANSCASEFCATAMSMVLVRDDGTLKGSIEANIVMELLRDLRGLGTHAFSMESIEGNADSNFMRNNMDAYGRYGALLLLAHNSFDYVKTMKDMLDMTDEKLSSAIFEDAVLDRRASRFVAVAMKASENGISLEGAEDTVSRHIGGDDIGVMPIPDMGNERRRTYFAEKDLETGIALVERRTEENGSGMYAVRIPVSERHAEDAIRAVVMIGLERHKESGTTELEGMGIDVIRLKGHVFLELKVEYNAGGKEGAENAVNSSAQTARDTIERLEGDEGRK
ncbi:MAG: hypothetical protein KGH69_04400 [Candidatus Micrarchaeota archaeon]|nr:hypothetical protein [Candidatus Micrarchaeota archaeon]